MDVDSDQNACFWKISFVLINDVMRPGRITHAVGNVSGNRCESDCRSRGRELNPGPVQYFHGDWSWNNFYSHSPPFHWVIQEGLLSVTSESMCAKYWLTACSSLPRKSVVRWTDRPVMTIVVDQTKQKNFHYWITYFWHFFCLFGVHYY